MYVYLQRSFLLRLRDRALPPRKVGLQLISYDRISGRGERKKRREGREEKEKGGREKEERGERKKRREEGKGGEGREEKEKGGRENEEKGESEERGGEGTTLQHNIMLKVSRI